MVEDIGRKSVIAVTLLGLGMLLLANPAYTGSGGGPSTLEAEATELNASELSPQELSQIPGFVYNIDIRAFENLNASESEAFQTAFEGIYTGDARVHPLVLYQDELYLGEIRQTEVGAGLVYEDFDTEGRILAVERNTLNEASIRAFETGVQEGTVALNNESIVLSAYDYVIENGTFYALNTTLSGNTRTAGADEANTTDEGNNTDETTNNETILTVTETTSEKALSPVFTPISEVEPEGLREPLTASIDSVQTLDPELAGDAREIRLVSHEGTLYQMRYQEGSVPISEALGLFNFGGMAVGVLLILSGLYLMREVYRSQTQEYRI